MIIRFIRDEEGATVIEYMTIGLGLLVIGSVVSFVSLLFFVLLKVALSL